MDFADGGKAFQGVLNFQRTGAAATLTAVPESQSIRGDRLREATRERIFTAR